MAKDPAFLMYYKQWLVSTSGWDADVRGWYINILCHQADKPDGLPNDIEVLAQLAGVKFSDFERFKQCWQRTLEAKFKISENNMLFNITLDKVIKDRKQYSENQARRGIVGFFVKNARNVLKITDEQATELSILLSKEDLVNKTKEERIDCYKRTLVALLGNVNVNVIVNGLKGGAGGKSGLPKSKAEPDWWVAERGNFLGDVNWKRDFCQKKNIGLEELTKRMNDFVIDLHLKGDYKDAGAIKVHFLNSYNKYVENKGNGVKDLKTKSVIDIPENFDYEGDNVVKW